MGPSRWSPDCSRSRSSRRGRRGGSPPSVMRGPPSPAPSARSRPGEHGTTTRKGDGNGGGQRCQRRRQAGRRPAGHQDQCRRARAMGHLLEQPAPEDTRVEPHRAGQLPGGGRVQEPGDGPDQRACRKRRAHEQRAQDDRRRPPPRRRCIPEHTQGERRRRADAVRLGQRCRAVPARGQGHAPGAGVEDDLPAVRPQITGRTTRARGEAMAEPGGGAGDLAAIGAAIMAGKPESIRRAATVFGDTTKNYGDAHEVYLTDTKKLMQTWEGAGADAYLDVANRTLGFIETTQQTISPDEAALNDAADALEEAQQAITEYMAKAQQYRDEMATNAQDPDEAGLTAEGQRILDALAKAYQTAAAKLKPIDNAAQKVGQNAIDPPNKLDLKADTGGAPDGPNAPNVPPGGDAPPGDVSTLGTAPPPDGVAPGGAPPPDGPGTPGVVVPQGEFLVFGAPGGPGGQPGGAVPGVPDGDATPGMPGTPGGSLVPSGMLLLSTPDDGISANAATDPPGPEGPVVPGVGSPFGADQTTDIVPGIVPGVFLSVGNPSGTGPGSGHSSTTCSDPSCTDPSHSFRQGDLTVPSI